MRHRYRYLYGNEVLTGDIEQIADYINVPVHQLKVSQRVSGNPTRLEERNAMYDLIDWRNEKEINNITFEALLTMWPVKDTRHYARAYHDGSVNRGNKLQITKIKRRPLEVMKIYAERD